MHSAAILERMRAWCAERDTASALEALAAAGLPAAQVLSPQQALDDAQAAAMAWFRPVADYPGLPRPAPVPDLPLRFSANTAGITRRPPLLGEHTDEVLRELGYDAAAIAELHRQGVT
jgi:crotonobetainyl-CoA:carnitine CoA-transferase CaiB-like acyl-CoA transferase